MNKIKTKNIAILGSTGSIGTQALEIIDKNPNLFEIYALTANNNSQLLIEQARKYNPELVVIANNDKYLEVKSALEKLPIKVFSGIDAVSQIVSMEPIDIVLTAMVGYAGLQPTIAAIKAKKTIALANKETLVVAGELITQLAIDNSTPIIPVDSEHSAIFQCLVGENLDSIRKVILTASGGPFRTLNAKELTNVTKAQALNHPNWDMGAKITIDSATMMNKGFEVIEAKWLFGLKANQIDVVIHPQSIIHSMVEFSDSSIKVQMGLPDMKLPIQYAFGYPNRIENKFPSLNFNEYNSLSFEEADSKKFRNLAYAYEAMEQGGNMPCILNAANEIVVEAFLKDKIGFLQMSNIIEQTMQKSSFIKKPLFDDYVDTNSEARRIADELINKL